jgi:hypothetical protein
VLPLTRIFPCSKEILVLARNLQGNKIYKEMASTGSIITKNYTTKVRYSLKIMSRAQQITLKPNIIK